MPFTVCNGWSTVGEVVSMIKENVARIMRKTHRCESMVSQNSAVSNVTWVSEDGKRVIGLNVYPWGARRVSVSVEVAWSCSCSILEVSFLGGRQYLILGENVILPSGMASQWAVLPWPWCGQVTSPFQDSISSTIKHQDWIRWHFVLSPAAKPYEATLNLDMSWKKCSVHHANPSPADQLLKVTAVHHLILLFTQIHSPDPYSRSQSCFSTLFFGSYHEWPRAFCWNMAIFSKSWFIFLFPNMQEENSFSPSLREVWDHGTKFWSNGIWKKIRHVLLCLICKSLCRPLALSAPAMENPESYTN